VDIVLPLFQNGAIVSTFKRVSYFHYIYIRVSCVYIIESYVCKSKTAGTYLVIAYLPFGFTITNIDYTSYGMRNRLLFKGVSIIVTMHANTASKMSWCST